MSWLLGYDLDKMMEGEADRTYPIAEIFESPQGEGQWTGTLMTFIRFAGCNVGKPYTSVQRAELDLNVYQDQCTAWDGKGFPCDTNYRMAERLRLHQLIENPLVRDARRICITGGEPLMHDLTSLLRTFDHLGKMIHLETSGTKRMPNVALTSNRLWICVSPKAGYTRDMLEIADEIKVLIGPGFDENMFVAAFGEWFDKNKVWVQPVNNELSIDRGNLDICLSLQKKYKRLRLSSQLHKVWGVR